MQNKNTNASSFLAGIKNMPEPQRTEAVAAINELVLLRFIERVAPQISSEQVDQLQNLQPQLAVPVGAQVDPKSQAAVMQWLTSAMPDYQIQLDAVLNELDAELTAKAAAAA